MTAPIHSWLVDPIDGDVKNAIRRLARADDAVHVAVMPDVHLADDVRSHIFSLYQRGNPGLLISLVVRLRRVPQVELWFGQDFRKVFDV